MAASSVLRNLPPLSNLQSTILPVTGEYGMVFVDGKKAEAKLIDNRWVLPDEVSGSVRIVVK
jgi:hypothetical protein